MNFETFLFILKKNFSVVVEVYENRAKVTYKNTEILFELTNTSIISTIVDAAYLIDIDFRYCTEITIIDYFISVLKLHNIKFED